MLSMPTSGWKAWRYHIAEKSPNVQPTKHRRVLTAARRHVGREVQKSDVAMDGALGLASLELLEHGVCWVH